MRPPRADEEDDWIRLARSENVGAATFHDLVARCGSAAAALEMMPELATRGGARRPLRIASRDVAAHERAAAKRLGARHVFLGSALYPPRLARIHAPPPVIMVRGDPALLSRRAIAVVGSRRASAAGRTMAWTLAEAFAAAERVVVSGLALGIDGEAHRAALAGGTVAVIAGGIDRPTPEEHLELAEEIAERGALVSEMPMGWAPFARDFPRRNRLIAGLSEGVVVVEAAARSGALHTARYALDQNREVFAVPGSPLDPRAAGALALLRDGATMVIEPRDVLDALGSEATTLPLGFDEPPAPFEAGPLGAGGFAAGVAGAAERVADALSLTPVSHDALVRATGLAAGAVAAAVVELELAGRAEREGDGRVRLSLADRGSR